MYHHVGIPSHLPIVEVINGFLDYFKLRGLVLFYILHRYDDLRPIVKAAMALHGLHLMPGPIVKGDSFVPHDDPTIVGLVSYSAAALSTMVDKKWLVNSKRLDHVEFWNDDDLHLLWPQYLDLNGSGAVE